MKELKERVYSKPMYGYGGNYGEVECFVRKNPCVSGWLNKYARAFHGRWLSGSRLNKARILHRFFKWLRVEKGIDIKPKELLNKQLQKRQSTNIEDRQWLLNLVVEHTRDNPDFADYSDKRKYNMFQTVKSFCNYYEVPLTTAKGIFGKIRRKKKHRKQITLSEAKRFISSVSQRDRAILLIMLQSGMEIGAVLNKFSYMWFSQVKPQLDAGCERLKIEFHERKRNDAWYFTYISRDAIHELRKWLQERREIINRLLEQGEEVSKEIIEGEPIFITALGNPLRERSFIPYFGKKTKGKITTHMFRKLFKTEASVPSRGINRKIVDFFMGHVNGIDDVGAEYDRTPEIHEEIFEKEYAKLEPFINIYSGSIVTTLEVEKKEMEAIKQRDRQIKALERQIQSLSRQINELRKDQRKSVEFFKTFYPDNAHLLLDAVEKRDTKGKLKIG